VSSRPLHNIIYTANNVATAATRILSIVAISYYGYQRIPTSATSPEATFVAPKKNRLTSVVLTLTLSLTAPRIPADLIIAS